MFAADASEKEVLEEYSGNEYIYKNDSSVEKSEEICMEKLLMNVKKIMRMMSSLSILKATL